VSYYAQVQDVRQVRRVQLFPDQPRDKRSKQPYYQLLLGPLQRLPQPILSRRFRRIVFIPTTWEKFNNASEINDLFDGSPLEDCLWTVFKRLKISAERQEFIALDSDFAALDFAIYCAQGKIDVETDGDTWHANPEKAAQDNRRDNALEMIGWSVLRFSTAQVIEQLMEYCIPTIATTINNLGGVDENGVVPRRIELSPEGGLHQKSLFDNL
jgi:very-short-patch-repair endonuclease